MIKKYIYLLKFKEIKDRIRFNQKGLTLVEVIIAFFIITLVSVVLIQGVSVSTKTLKVNKAKTEAVAMINEEIEKIRFRDYSDVGIVGATGGNPEGYLDPVSVVGDFTVNRDITWVDGEYSFKQVEITVMSDRMHEEIVMVTQVSPIFGEGG
ncbi:MAG: type II secretion system GspH family protein, partial [Actinomycetia bacterium]|nr:type II secretion system GspH family protein [Actinomycetes bacterium]